MSHGRRQLYPPLHTIAHHYTLFVQSRRISSSVRGGGVVGLARTKEVKVERAERREHVVGGWLSPRGFDLFLSSHPERGPIDFFEVRPLPSS